MRMRQGIKAKSEKRILEGNVLGVVNKEIETLFNRMRDHHRHDFTSAEMLTTFVKPEHREIAVEVVELYGRRSTLSQDLVINTPAIHNIYASLNEPAFAVPDYAGQKLMDDAPEGFADRLIAWYEKRVQLSHKFGKLHGVVACLNYLCQTPEQMRVLFPAITMLTDPVLERSTHAQNQRLHERLHTFKITGDLPAVGTELRQGIREASGLLAACKLLEEPESRFEPVSLYINNARQMEPCVLPWWHENMPADVPRFANTYT